MKYDEACAILGVPLGASGTAVHLAWRQRVKRIHPDRNQGRVLNERATKELNEARRVAVQMRPVHLPRAPSERKSKIVVDWDSALSNAQAAVRRKPGGARRRKPIWQDPPQPSAQPRSERAAPPRPRARPTARPEPSRSRLNVWYGIMAAVIAAVVMVGVIAAVVLGTGLVTPDQLEKLLP